jgi:hypothetical protein
MNVSHDDRQIEFFDAVWHVNYVVDSLYGSQGSHTPKVLGAKSCEMIAKEIFGQLTEPYRSAVVWIKVQEDDENYAVVNF